MMVPVVFRRVYRRGYKAERGMHLPEAFKGILCCIAALGQQWGQRLVHPKELGSIALDDIGKDYGPDLMRWGFWGNQLLKKASNRPTSSVSGNPTEMAFFMVSNVSF
jgi:hypothetical protein